MSYYNSIVATDWFIAPVYFAVITAVASSYKKKHIEDKPYFKYFMPGLYAKLFGAFSVTAIYHFYYGGGDTINYFHSSCVLLKLADKDFGAFISLMLDNRSWEIFSSFDGSTGWPLYWRDDNSFAVVRYTTFFTFLGMRHFIATSFLLASFAYAGIWRLFTVFVELFPKYEKWFAIAVLFMPSCIFWGSGILKDTFTYAAICMLVYLFYRFLSDRNKLKYILSLSTLSYITITLKPYIFITFAASALAWFSVGQIHKIKNRFIRVILFPLLTTMVFGVGVFFYQTYGELLGRHYSSVDVMLERAVVIQDDLKKDYYGGNTFDIGHFEASFSGILSKFPQAILAGLFRPYLWEVQSPLMLLSALENIFFLAIVLYLLIRVGIWRLMKNIFSKPNLITFCFLFSVSLAFIVGLTTSNFGSLVRYKIPTIPFFLSMLIIMYIKKQEDKAAEDKKTKTRSFSSVPKHLKDIS